MSKSKSATVAIAAVAMGLSGVAVGYAFVASNETQPPPAEATAPTREDTSVRDVRASEVATAWLNLASFGAEEVEHFSTLADISDTTEVVITGKVTAARPGRPLADSLPDGSEQNYQFLELTIDVTDNLGAATGTQYAVEFGPYPAEELAAADWASELVSDEGIFVLRRKGSANPDTGATRVESEYELDKYRLVSSQGLLLDDGGQVVAPLAEDTGFPNNLVGADYEVVVERVDELAE